jgi:hypothetical protein
MKKIIIVTMLFLFGGIANSQTKTNNELASNYLANKHNKKINFIQGWHPSHGKPSVLGTTEKDTWVWMWSHSNLGEGVVTNYNFEVGKTYQISFRIKTSSNISKPNDVVLNSTANVRAVSGIATKTVAYEIPKIPTSSEVIWSKPVKKTLKHWKTVVVTFTPTNNNSQLWFYPLMTADANANGGARIQMEIDHVAIKMTSQSQSIKSEVVDNTITYSSLNPIKKEEL